MSRAIRIQLKEDSQELALGVLSVFAYAIVSTVIIYMKTNTVPLISKFMVACVQRAKYVCILITRINISCYQHQLYVDF